MHLYRHHSCGDRIELDDRTGRWIPVEDDDSPGSIGLMSMLQRASFSIRGSYTIENGQRYCFYWNEDGELVFRTPGDTRFCLFRLEHDNCLTDLRPDLRVELEPVPDRANGSASFMSTFRLVDNAGTAVVEVTYDAVGYQYMRAFNFTFVPDEELRDWDLFVCVKEEVGELKRLALAQLWTRPDRRCWRPRLGEVVTGQSSEPARRPGDWIARDHVTRRCRVALGEPLPDLEGNQVTWVWVAPLP